MVRALGFVLGFALTSGAWACGTCVALGQDLHRMPAFSGNELLPPIPQDQSPTFPLVVPAYSSRPNATAKLYLDFDGDFTSTWGSYHPNATPAYSTDDDPSSFTQAELDNIQEIWLRVSEAYSPFNIDVTTINPGVIQDRVTMRVVVGGDGKNGAATYWPGARAGGIGYVGGFSNTLPNTAFVFPGNLANGTPKYTAMAIAHEAGHALGLQHQSEYSGFFRVQEYSDNDPTTTGDGAGKYSAQPTAPFMGVAYFAERAIWFSGTSTSSVTIQNDVDIIASADNAFGYYQDEAPGEAIFATPFTRIGNALLASGVITTVDDHDFFSFTTDDDSYTTFTVTGAPFGGMLDASMALYDESGLLIEMVATSSLGEFMGIVIPAGAYALDIFSAGNVGDIGQFSVTGMIGPVPEPGVGLMLLSILPFLGCRRRA